MGVVVPINSHPRYRRRHRATLTPPPVRPALPREKVEELFSLIATCLHDLQQEGQDQRNILRALTLCVQELKLTMDYMVKKIT